VKITLLTPSFLPVVGGAELGALELARRLTARGHTTSVVTPRLHPEWAATETLDGIDVHRFPVAAPGGRHRTGNIAVSSLLALGPLWRRLSPDVLNLHYLLPTGLAGQWWAGRVGIPTVTTLIGMDVYDPHYRPAAPWRLLMRRTVRRTRAVICISSFVRGVVERDYPPAPGVPCHVIPHGVDVKTFRPQPRDAEIRREYGVGPEDRLVLTVQRLYPRKGVRTFLEAAVRIARECPRARFVVAGEGPERAALERRATELGLSRRLVFTGAVPAARLPALYASADVFAFHTFHEGLGIVLLEAQASGCPVVTTAAGGTLDIVRDGDTGLLAPPGDPEAFAHAITRVLGDDALARRLRARGRQVIEAQFDWDVVVERYLEVFELASRRPASA
jgi:glycosyltransferase involved in cell wall biosynthesis